MLSGEVKISHQYSGYIVSKNYWSQRKTSGELLRGKYTRAPLQFQSPKISYHSDFLLYPSRRKALRQNILKLMSESGCTRKVSMFNLKVFVLNLSESLICLELAWDCKLHGLPRRILLLGLVLWTLIPLLLLLFTVKVKDNHYMHTSSLQFKGTLELNCNFFSKAIVSILVQAPVISQKKCHHQYCFLLLNQQSGTYYNYFALAHLCSDPEWLSSSLYGLL